MSLAPRSRFIQPTGAYLATAAQGLPPRSAAAAGRAYLDARAAGGEALEAARQALKGDLARLLGLADAGGIALLGSTSEGINAVYGLIDWAPGDNVVLLGDELEFPSVVLPALEHQRRGLLTVRRAAAPGDAGRAVRADDLARVLDERTRLVFASHVSYRTGYRLDLDAVRRVMRERGQARLAVDASQSLGVVPVALEACDLMVSTAFKWLLGAHGVAVLYWNRERFPEARPRALGWHSVAEFTTGLSLKADAERFELGNAPYLAVYALAAGVRTLLEWPAARVEAHALDLAQALRARLVALGLPVLTPPAREERAGIVAWRDSRAEATAARLAERGVRVTGNVGRVRAAVHLYNDLDDVERLTAALSESVS